MKKREYYDLVLDLDMTVINSCQTVINLTRAQDGLKPIKVDFNKLDWNFNPYYNKDEDVNRCLHNFINPNFYNVVEPFNSAIEQIKKWSEEYSICICSCQCDERRPFTKAWIESTFNNKVDFVPSYTFEDKANVINKCGLFIDDRLDAIKSMSEKDIANCCLCIGPYNWNNKINKEIGRIPFNFWTDEKEIKRVENILNMSRIMYKVSKGEI